MSPYRDIVPFDPEVDMERPDLSASQARRAQFHAQLRTAFKL